MAMKLWLVIALPAVAFSAYLYFFTALDFFAGLMIGATAMFIVAAWATGVP